MNPLRVPITLETRVPPEYKTFIDYQTEVSTSIKATQICNKIGFSGQLRVEAQGFQGGIWLFWRTDKVTVTPFGDHSQHLTVQIAKFGDDPWLFSAIYASPDSILRKELWDELEKIKNSYSSPWILGGDFNEMMTMDERNGVGGSKMQRRCRDFSNLIENNELIDLGCSGPEHTWIRGNSPETFKSARLDRAFANEARRMKFDEATVRNLPKSQSDHCPIRVSTTGFAPLPMAIKPFRFQATSIIKNSQTLFIGIGIAMPR
ncbi:uncharacterized protein LOC110682912 [Chenopodium quinoa]|uniref:uncharacterized protein LOC110682912 n=1 Tax=Chenopodium quinoa TaxID=63459 RepID=UPI000B778A22|nr:uncharacterized protein LOC110682912 [Chenopodium quinoa]